jgi:hypothetical protein
LIIVIVFAALSAFIMIRKTDGAGPIQTVPDRMAAEVVLGVVFIIVVIIQLVIHHFVKR